MKSTGMFDWIFRFVKGMFIGSGAILPGVSGGALAAVFGFYEKIIDFVANITKDFKKNLLYFLPVGLGGLFGVFVLSFLVSFLLGAAETQILWFFIGCIVGTMPALWGQAGKHGRKHFHYAIMAVSGVLGFIFLQMANGMIGGALPQNIWTWLLSGAIIGLGVVVPGLSPSNFLVYLGMYKPMTDGIKTLDLGVIVPIGIGGVLCVLCLSRLINWVLKKAYAGMFHFILGVVAASTVMIVPTNFNYLSTGTIICLINCVLGFALGYWMSMLEKRYKPQD